MIEIGRRSRKAEDDGGRAEGAVSPRTMVKADPGPRSSAPGGTRKLLVIDTAYTRRIMSARNLFSLVTGRDLDGYFRHVWSCHPFAAVIDDERSPDRFGPARTYRLGAAHTLVEGSGARFRWLGRFPRLNFLLSQLGVVLGLLRLVRKERIDFVRAEDPLYNGMLAWIIARLSGRPLIIGVWGNPGQVRKSTGRPLMPRLFRTVRLEERVERFVLRRADLALAQNEDNRRFLLSAGVPPERTSLFRFGNLIESAHFTEPTQREGGRAELERLGIADRPVLLVISRLEKLKLVDHVLMALAELKARNVQPVVLFAGDGPYRPEMEEVANRLGIRDQVRFLGNMPQDWFVRVLPCVSAVVSPLTGRALAEAALAGAPVAAYDIDWHSELIVGGETGELAPYLDHVELAESIGRLIADPTRARTLGCNLRAKAVELLDPQAADRAQTEAYEALARGPRTG